MMPDVSLTPKTFERLQRLAKPFVDTPETVIARLLDLHEGQQGQALAGAEPPRGTRRFDPLDAPDLTHTKLVAAEIDGKPARNWNALVDIAHRLAAQALKSYDALRDATQSHIVRGKKTDSGFHYLPDIDASIQGIDADLAWRNTLHLARRLKVPVRVEFEWRDKPGAAYPGKHGVLEWVPKK
jgi:hypothetical protein